MRNFGSRKSWRSVLQSRPFLILLFLVVLVFAWSVIGLWTKMVETGKNKRIAEAKIAELQEQKEKLSLDIGKLNTDAGLEDSIRDKFGFAKEGEGLIVIIDEKEESEVPLEANTWSIFSFFSNW